MVEKNTINKKQNETKNKNGVKRKEVQIKHSHLFIYFYLLPLGEECMRMNNVK